MAPLPRLVLRKNQDRRVRGGHPWVFSNEIATIEGAPADGDLVEIADFRGAFLGRAYFNHKSLICARVLTRVDGAAGQGWYLTYHYWPTSAGSHMFEGTLYFVPAKTARERIAHELAAVTFKEYSLQDANTLEATQSMVESRVVERFPLNDQEILCRHLHKEVANWVEAYKETAGV